MKDSLYVEVLKRASSFLEEHGFESYLAEYLLLERQGWSKTEFLSQLRQPADKAVWEQLNTDISEVITGQPPQYVIGSTDFFGYRFQVTPDTLIPRPETEELVQKCLISNNHDEKLKVLDIGTGTGAIALTLKKEVPNWEVTAIDISKNALAVAAKNSKELDVDVTLIESDLTVEVSQKTFDIILSNPPYIADDEWDVMDDSVRNFEPKLALFADNQGLAIYERLAKELPYICHDDTKIYLEIGYKQGGAVKRLFEQGFPTKRVSILPDMFGQDRMIIIE